MKIKLAIIGLFAFALTAFSQTNNSELKSAFISFVQNVESNKAVSVAVYPGYAPDIVVNGKKDNFGLGIAALCPASALPALEGTTVGNHAFVGLRFDYLAHQAFASTVGVGVRGDFQIYGHNISAFAHSGVNIPFSGFGLKNGDIGAMAGGGLYTSVYKFSDNASLGVQLSAEKWTQFQGYVLHGGPVFNWSF
jgi:hypothetical protein